jgi:hypothetical protein
VFRRTDDPQQLLQDLTHQGGPAGYQVGCHRTQKAHLKSIQADSDMP